MPVTRGPARIRITDPRGETVYEGEGEIQQCGEDLVIAQYRRMDDEVLSRHVQFSQLMRSARSEFLHDPHGYDHPNTNEMRWSPPEDGEEVPSCPA